MEKENELILGSVDDKKQVFLDDIFHINTEQPVPLSKKIKNKLFKWSKPFGLGLGAYFLYELLKKVGSTLMEWGQSAYQYCVDIIDKINVYLLTTPAPVAPPPVNSDSASPATIGEMTNTIAGNMSGMVDILSVMSYLIGIGMGMQAALKLKEHNESPDRIPLSQPVTMMMVSAMLISLPSMLTVTTTTTFGTGTQTTQATVIEESSNTMVVSTPEVNVPVPVIVQEGK